MRISVLLFNGMSFIWADLNLNWRIKIIYCDFKSSSVLEFVLEKLSWDSTKRLEFGNHMAFLQTMLMVIFKSGLTRWVLGFQQKYLQADVRLVR